MLMLMPRCEPALVGETRTEQPIRDNLVNVEYFGLWLVVASWAQSPAVGVLVHPAIREEDRGCTEASRAANGTCWKKMTTFVEFVA